MEEAGELVGVDGEVADKVVVIKVEDFERFEALKELGRKGFIEHVIGEVEKTEAGDEGELRWDRAVDLVGGDGEVYKEVELADVRGESAGEVVTGDVE